MKKDLVSTCSCSARTFAMLCALLIAPLGGAALQAETAVPANTQQSEKRKLIRSWQGYFRALHTLESEWVMKGTFPGEPKEHISFSYKFLWDRGRYRSDMYISTTKPRKPGDYQSTTASFDGKYYRSLRTTFSGERRFGLSDPPKEPVIYHEVIAPILSAFLFVFEEGIDPFTIDALQGDAIWQRFEKRIVSIERGEWQGRQGRWLYTVDPEYAEEAKIFVDDANNFPMFVTGLNQYVLTKKEDTSDEAYDSEVARTVKWRDGATTYVYPTRIVRRDWIKEIVNGTSKRTASRLVLQATTPVKINQPLDASRFKINIPAKTVVFFAPTANSKPDRQYPFLYDPQGGSLWEQEQRERRRIAALPKLYDEKANAKTQIEKALAGARSDNKRVLLLFGANWCGPCRTLHGLLKQNREIARILQQSFVVVPIDWSQKHNADAVGQHAGPGQDGPPFLVVLEADGKRLAAPLTTSLTISPTENADFDPKKMAAFLNQWKPKK